jgi:hypothetical protein
MSDDGLRELPPAQAIHTQRGLLARKRYIPLAILFLLAFAGMIVGVSVKAVLPTPTTTPTAPPFRPFSAPGGSESGPNDAAAPAAAASDLPEKQCAPGVDQKLDGEPWLDPSEQPASEAKFQSGIATENPAYIEGEDGWLFFTDGQINDFSQGLGRVTLSSDQITAWADYFTGLKKAANENGSSFYIVIAPAKWDVYPQELPDWAQELRGTNSFDLLLSSHPELPIIDTRAALRKAAAKDDTYARQDSHWTEYGAYTAWKAIASCLSANDPALAGIGAPKIDGVTTVDDHNEFGGDGVVTAKDWTVPEYTHPHPPTTVTSLTGQPIGIGADNFIPLELLPAMTQTEGAQSGLSLLALRDSTGNALSPFLTRSFASTVQLSHTVGSDKSIDLGALVSQYGSNVTLFVMTERYLAFGPPPTSG